MDAADIYVIHTNRRSTSCCLCCTEVESCMYHAHVEQFHACVPRCWSSWMSVVPLHLLGGWKACFSHILLYCADQCFVLLITQHFCATFTLDDGGFTFQIFTFTLSKVFVYIHLQLRAMVLRCSADLRTLDRTYFVYFFCTKLSTPPRVHYLLVGAEKCCTHLLHDVRDVFHLLYFNFFFT